MITISFIIVKYNNTDMKIKEFLKKVKILVNQIRVSPKPNFDELEEAAHQFIQARMHLGVGVLEEQQQVWVKQYLDQYYAEIRNIFPNHVLLPDLSQRYRSLLRQFRIHPQKPQQPENILLAIQREQIFQLKEQESSRKIRKLKLMEAAERSLKNMGNNFESNYFYLGYQTFQQLYGNLPIRKALAEILAFTMKYPEILKGGLFKVPYLFEKSHIPHVLKWCLYESYGQLIEACWDQDCRILYLEQQNIEMTECFVVLSDQLRQRRIDRPQISFYFVGNRLVDWTQFQYTSRSQKQRMVTPLTIQHGNYQIQVVSELSTLLNID